MRRFLLASLVALFPVLAFGQRNTISTNLVDWANFGTVNAEYGYSLSQHISIVEA